MTGGAESDGHAQAREGAGESGAGNGAGAPAASAGAPPSRAVIAQAVKAARVEWSAVEVDDELGRGTDTVVYSGKWRGPSSSSAPSSSTGAADSSATAGDSAPWSDLAPGTPVAVKVLDQHAQAETRNTFRIEVEVVLGQLGRHDGVLNYFAWGERTASDRCPFLVMEILSRDSAPASRWRRRVAEKPRRAYRIMLQVARALHFMHARGLIHRDLKSSNVLVTRDFSVAKLTDFGVSRKALGEQESEMTATTGTFQWMAPEVIAGENYNSKADVYSFGVMLNELLTGKAPFEESYITPVQAATAVAMHGKRPRLAKASGKIPERVVDLIQRCWVRAPSERPTTSELVDVLGTLDNEYGRHADGTASGSGTIGSAGESGVSKGLSSASSSGGTRGASDSASTPSRCTQQ